MNHEEHCNHDLAHCEHCDAVWCRTCKKEWGTACTLNHYPEPSISIPPVWVGDYWPYAPGTTTTIASGNVGDLWQVMS